MRKLLMLVVVLSGLTLGNPVPDLASDFVELGWWVVPCEDVLAIPDLERARAVEAAEAAICLRNHHVDVEIVKQFVSGTIADVEWQDIFTLLHTGAAPLGEDRFQVILIPMTGALILSFEPIEPD